MSVLAFGNTRGDAAYKAVRSEVMRYAEQFDVPVGSVVLWSHVVTPVGDVAVAGSVEGVVAVAVASPAESAEDTLAGMLSEDTVMVEDNSNAYADTLRVLAWIASGAGDNGVNLPIDVSGSDWQIQVWEALACIPIGVVRTYRDIAVLLGNTDGARAVGSACGANPVALIIPCHRVVPVPNGSTSRLLGGYRWGIAVKQYLLESETLWAGR